MAQVLSVNGQVESGQQFGRALEVFEITCTAHGIPERELIMIAMREHGSIEIVGDFGTANTFRLAMSGTNRTAAELAVLVQAAGTSAGNAAVAAATIVNFVF